MRICADPDSKHWEKYKPTLYDVKLEKVKTTSEKAGKSRNLGETWFEIQANAY